MAEGAFRRALTAWHLRSLSTRQLADKVRSSASRAALGRSVCTAGAPAQPAVPAQLLDPLELRIQAALTLM